MLSHLLRDFSGLPGDIGRETVDSLDWSAGRRETNSCSLSRSHRYGPLEADGLREETHTCVLLNTHTHTHKGIGQGGKLSAPR